MHEDPNNPRLWLVTGVRYRDVSECYTDFITDLRKGDVMQVMAACFEQGTFKNLGAYTEWHGQNLNVGVISSKMRDEAATYLDDDGFMEVRVVEIGDKDFWVEPVAETPLRPKAERLGIPPLPFDQSLVPFRSPGDARRQSATNQILTLLHQIEDNSDLWTWVELREHVERLISLLHRYPESCLHSLCEEEDKTLRSILGCLRDVCQLLDRHKGMSESNDRLKAEYEAIEQIEHEYSKPQVCARIYKEEMAELDRLAHGQQGMLMQFFEQLRLANNDQDPTIDQLNEELQGLNTWLSGFMNGWYTRTKRNMTSLATTIKCEHLTRRELYGYYSCEILAQVVKQVSSGQRTIAEILCQPIVASVSKQNSPVNDPTLEDYDPYQILPANVNKQQVRDAVIEVDSVTLGVPYKYAHVQKVMIDYRITTMQQSDQADFAQTLLHWHLGSKSKDATALKNSIRQRTDKIMEQRGCSKARNQVLPPFWLWPENDADRQICEQIAPIFEQHGFRRPSGRLE